MSRIVHDIHGAITKTKENAQDMKDMTKKLADEKFLDMPHVDLRIQFIGASGLPKTDVVGSSDPYFVANIDHKISYVSAVVTNNLNPVWNEIWMIRNVPWDADLNVDVLDKDVGSPRDDLVGKFKTSVTAGAKEMEIESLMTHRKRGTFWLKIESEPSKDTDTKKNEYIFDGPIRFSRHFSPTLGLLTSADKNENKARLYSTWKMFLRGVPLFFEDRYQPWNKDYKAAQNIFQGPTSIAVRSGVQAAHRALYARSTRNDFGVIAGKEDIRRILRGGMISPNQNQDASEGGITSLNDPSAKAYDSSDHLTTEAALHPPGDHEAQHADPSSRRTRFTRAISSRSNSDPNETESQGSLPSTLPKSPFSNRIKPAIYTYIISAEDSSFRFSETGAAFFVDFASKHALHSNCATTVRYSGEFHPRPAGGWDAFNSDVDDGEVEWELVVDNNSGTYSPDPKGLQDLKRLLEYNFPGFGIVALDYKEEALKESVAACRRYAVERRGVREEDLEPHLKEGEVSLMKQASMKTGPGEGRS